MKEMHVSKIIAIIPARIDSKRLPGKVLMDLGGKAILHHVVDRAVESGCFTEVIVATDDQRVVDYCNQNNINVELTNKDLQSGTDRVGEVAERKEADYIVNIQGDEPFIKVEDIRVLCDLLRQDDVEIATLYHDIIEIEKLHDFNAVKVTIDKSGKALYFSRQAIPAMRDKPYREWHHHHTYLKHVGVYGFKKSTLQKLIKLSQSPLELTESLEQLRWLEYGYAIRCAKVDQPSIGIDTEEELKAARKLFTKY